MQGVAESVADTVLLELKDAVALTHDDALDVIEPYGDADEHTDAVPETWVEALCSAELDDDGVMDDETEGQCEVDVVAHALGPPEVVADAHALFCALEEPPSEPEAVKVTVCEIVGVGDIAVDCVAHGEGVPQAVGVGDTSADADGVCELLPDDDGPLDAVVAAVSVADTHRETVAVRDKTGEAEPVGEFELIEETEGLEDSVLETDAERVPEDVALAQLETRTVADGVAADVSDEHVVGEVVTDEVRDDDDDAELHALPLGVIDGDDDTMGELVPRAEAVPNLDSVGLDEPVADGEGLPLTVSDSLRVGDTLPLAVRDVDELDVRDGLAEAVRDSDGVGLVDTLFEAERDVRGVVLVVRDTLLDAQLDASVLEEGDAEGERLTLALAERLAPPVNEGRFEELSDTVVDTHVDRVAKRVVPTLLTVEHAVGVAHALVATDSDMLALLHGENVPTPVAVACSPVFVTLAVGQ